MNILIFIYYYLPGYRAGGALRTISNMVEALGDDINFRIVTSDHDCGDRTLYEGLEKSKWVKIGKAEVYYATSEELNVNGINKIIDKTDFDIVYLQSFWNFRFSQIPIFILKFLRKDPRPILLAPRGEFGNEVIKRKKWKKLPYRLFTKILGVHKKIFFHCSSVDEKRDLHKIMGNKVKSWTALDIPDCKAVDNIELKHLNSKKIKTCFLSRIVPNKNLLFAIKTISNLDIDIEYDIYGVKEDINYWNRCENEIKKLPDNVKVKYCGEIENNRVIEVLSDYDIFFFPSLNENFSHVIHEALRSGLPVLTSNTVPWHELASRGAGWQFSPDDAKSFADTLSEYAYLNDDEKINMRKSAREYGLEVALSPQIREDNINMFNAICKGVK